VRETREIVNIAQCSATIEETREIVALPGTRARMASTRKFHLSAGPLNR
jgi:hypothetical protein